jgi:peroxiredoxin
MTSLSARCSRPLVLALTVWLAPLSVAAATPVVHVWNAEVQTLRDHIEPGNWTLLMFWSVTCEICAREVPALSRFADAQRGEGVRVLGVSIDGEVLEPRVRRWMTQHDMRFDTLLASLGDAARYYGRVTGERFMGTPTFLLFNREGAVVGVNAGPVRIEALQAFIDRKESEAR